MMMNNQTTTALVHLFIVIVLLVTFSWVGLVDFSWQKLPDSIETFQAELVLEDELPMLLSYEIQILKRAQRIESPKVGVAGSRSEIFQAYQTILAANEAEQIFKHLLNDKNKVTKVYAMKGLQTINSPLFNEIEPYFSNSQQSVYQVLGCLVSEKRISDLIEDHWLWKKTVPE